MKPVSVLLVDDHRLFREGLSALLSTDARIAVVGQGANGNEAVTLARALEPDIILLDVEMPGPPVMSTLEQLRNCAPSSKVIILTMHAQPGLMGQLINLGASGYLMKDMEIEELISAVLSIGNDTRDFVTLHLPRSIIREINSPDAGDNPLTRREIEILVLAAKAKSNLQIGSALFITEGTVKRHLSNIFRKIGAISRLDAVRKSIDRGWISIPSEKTLTRKL
ncbi:response regulator transcription factor [Arthrobacter sp. NQ7]|uniref:response regulator n=1 Tax=Arthrobacter sp. NQ7 TaxID=3032303 RepID=UPI00241092B5|nr:response regulator transcription factor [Arthrobacter sp. NQ7]MDJ0459824.1 response regulator transcription factor [Arthrobacter sp. NQ7]